MRILAVGVMALALAAPMAVRAQSADENIPTARASYAGLDLSREQDAQLMLNRVNNAALQACGASQESFSEYQAAVQRSDCYQEGVSQAVAQLNAPEVSRLYRRGAAVSVSAE